MVAGPAVDGGRAGCRWWSGQLSMVAMPIEDDGRCCRRRSNVRSDVADLLLFDSQLSLEFGKERLGVLGVGEQPGLFDDDETGVCTLR